MEQWNPGQLIPWRKLIQLVYLVEELKTGKKWSKTEMKSGRGTLVMQGAWRETGFCRGQELSGLASTVIDQNSETNQCHTYHYREAADRLGQTQAFHQRSGHPPCRGPASPLSLRRRLLNTTETKAVIIDVYSTRTVFLPFPMCTLRHTHEYTSTHAYTALEFFLYGPVLQWLGRQRILALPWEHCSFSESFIELL